MSAATPSRAPVVSAPRHSALPRVFTVLVFATLFLAPVEGYVQRVNGSASKAVPALLLLTWAGWRVWRWSLPRQHTVCFLALAMIGVVLASVAVNTDNAFALLYTARWLPFLVLCICLVDLLSTQVPLQLAVYAMAAGGTAAGAGALYSFAVLGQARASGPMDDPNDLAGTLVAALPLLLLGVNRPQASRTVRVLAIVAATICLLGMAVTVSRGGALAVAVLVVWAVWRDVITARIAMIATILVLAAGSVFVFVNQSMIETAIAQKENVATANIDARTTRWAAALAQLADNPVLGVGPGGNRQHYQAYSNRAEIAETTPVTHNMYIEVASELGLVGLAVFLAIILAAFNSGFRSRSGDQSTVLALEASLLATCVASFFLSEEYYMSLWATVAALAAVSLRQEDQPCASYT